MTVFDCGTYLVDNEAVSTEEADKMYDKLDEMLNEYNVEHSFMYLTDSEVRKFEEEKKEAPLMKVIYTSEQEMTFELVYLLWAKAVVGTDDSKIEKAFARYLAK